MPHSIFLGSALATQDRISFRAPQDDAGARNSVSQKETDDSLQNQPSEKVSLLRRLYNNFKKNILDAFVKPTANQSRNCYGERQNNSFEFVRAHIYYGMVDMVGSLFGFAVMINSLYVIHLFCFFRVFSHSFVFINLCEILFYFPEF
jgi:metal iron transporter